MGSHVKASTRQEKGSISSIFRLHVYGRGVWHGSNLNTRLRGTNRESLVFLRCTPQTGHYIYTRERAIIVLFSKDPRELGYCHVIDVPTVSNGALTSEAHRDGCDAVVLRLHHN